MQLGEALRRLGLFRGGSNGDYHSELRAREEAAMHERLWKLLDTDGSGRIHFDAFSRFLSLVVDKTETVELADDTPVYVVVNRCSYSSQMILLAREFSKLSLNKLAYAPVRTVRTQPASSDCTFTPSINPHSRIIEQQMQQSVTQVQGYCMIPLTFAPRSQMHSFHDMRFCSSMLVQQKNAKRWSGCSVVMQSLR